MSGGVITIRGLDIGNQRPLTLIAGPCQLESRAHAFTMAAALRELAKGLGIGFIFKASFDKANRTSLSSPRGVGLEAAVPIFRYLKEELGVPITTDVHEAWQCDRLADVVDLLQIPAFLCRQTDLIVAAARTGLPVNIKKGQTVTAAEMAFARRKAVDSGNAQVMLTERGSYALGNLVVDMRDLARMADHGAPVIFDATHSVQVPGGNGGQTGGDRRFVPVLARAAVAAGVAGVFLETHDDPDKAPSDGATMLPLSQLRELLADLIAIDRLVKGRAS